MIGAVHVRWSFSPKCTIIAPRDNGIQNAHFRVVGRSDFCSLRPRCIDFPQREKPNPGNQEESGPKNLWFQETTGSSREIHGTHSPNGEKSLTSLNSSKVIADGLLVWFSSPGSLCYGAYPCHLHGKEHLEGVLRV